MFVRVKKVGPYQYLQIAENRREGKRVKQTIIATLGRLDKLTASGAFDQLLRSAARFAERVFHTGEYFDREGLVAPARIMPSIVFRLQLPDPDARYHVPVIVSPHGYSAWWSG